MCKKVCPDLDHIQKCTIGILTEMILRSTKIKCTYKDSKIFTMDANDHDLCCMCTNHDFAHKSKVDTPCLGYL